MPERRIAGGFGLVRSGCAAGLLEVDGGRDRRFEKKKAVMVRSARKAIQVMIVVPYKNKTVLEPCL